MEKPLVFKERIQLVNYKNLYLYKADKVNRINKVNKICNNKMKVNKMYNSKMEASKKWNQKIKFFHKKSKSKVKIMKIIVK